MTVAIKNLYRGSPTVGPVYSQAGTMPSVSSWYGVAYGNGTFVAIINAGNAASSTDGITWTSRTMPSTAGWEAVTYGNGLFVAVSNSTAAATSPDGITWTARTLPSSSSWWGIKYGNGMYVTTSSVSATFAASSPDGITWTARTLPATGAWQALTYGKGKFVAIASTSTNGAYSIDGITWTSMTMPSAAGWTSVAYGNGTFVAAASGFAATSTDGINWTLQTMPTGSFYDTLYGNGIFLAVNYGNTAFVWSRDGATWYSETLPSSLSNAFKCCFGADKFICPAISSTASGIISAQPSSIYTVPASTTTVLSKIEISNSLNQTGSLVLRAGSDNQFIFDGSIPAYSRKAIDTKQVLSTGTVLSAISSDGITISIDGEEVT